MDTACFLEATAEASNRTKNRVRDHGPIFTILERKITQRFPGVESILVETNSWTGWLPTNELSGVVLDD